MTDTPPPLPYDPDRVAAIAARLELRRPNQEALESIVLEIARHFEIDREPPPLEAVADVATGVGKTYVLAAAIDYLAGGPDGTRDFAVIAPGRTILDKTVANFTPGHPKSLLRGLETRPVVVTADNFATPAMRAALDDPAQVKLFIFTVQSLLKPETKTGRKTHKFQEGLGHAFYAHLQSLDDLVVFADEHHAYYGAAFSRAIRDLRPRVLLGLTATPHKQTPPDQIIYRYPLAAAIADHLVKTPVLVGRKDDRSDPRTKLLDGLRLLDLKQQTIARWLATAGAGDTPVTPIMLVVAPTIAEAEEIEGILADPAFADGRYADQVLTVHSNAPDEALAQLDRLEDPDNPYRVVVSVGMLKEGWDVKNVYVIASLRASVSEILTEQTLGRGLRLPFGRYTGIELLDTLEVLGHERYEDLLKKAGVLNEAFVDHRTRAVLRRNAAGDLVPVSETTPVHPQLLPTCGPGSDPDPDPRAVGGEGGAAGPFIASVEDQTTRAESQLAALRLQLLPRPDLPPIRIPKLAMTTLTSDFSLADIIDLDPFRRLGQSIAADPAATLRRTTLGARVVTAADGSRQTELVTARALDRVASPASPVSLPVARQRLIAHVLNAEIVPARAKEAGPAAEIVDAFIDGLGPAAETVLSSFEVRAEDRLVQLLTAEQKRAAAKPTYGEITELIEFAKPRPGRAETSADRYGPFKKGVGYGGYRKSLYAQDWFDSSPERDVANLLEDEDAVTHWLRLQIDDLPILWTGGREYNPDFAAVDAAGTHWLIEVKGDKDLTAADVQAKRDAARRWANHVTADPAVATRWRYLLASETDVRTAKGSWPALKALATP